MPKDNVERAIKKASSKDQASYDEINYEGYCSARNSYFCRNSH
ncbi:MAG: hypothetical protein R2777_08085 [Chitinophagales bacterium]